MSTAAVVTDLGHEDIFTTETVVGVRIVKINIRYWYGSLFAEVLHSCNLGLGLEARHELARNPGNQLPRVNEGDEISLISRKRKIDVHDTRRHRPCEMFLISNERLRRDIDMGKGESSLPELKKVIRPTSQWVFSRTISLRTLRST